MFKTNKDEYDRRIKVHDFFRLVLFSFKHVVPLLCWQFLTLDALGLLGANAKVYTSES